jgi:FkbM family methyltransferase
MIKNEIIKYWDDNICEGHLNSESSIVIDYFKSKGIVDIKYIDIGANVGKYYDVLSKHFTIKNCVMFEGSRILSEYLKTKFKETPTVEVFNYAISNEDKLTYFSEETIEYFLNKDDLDGLNLGLSQISPNGGTPTQMRDIYGLLNERFDFFSDFNFIKVDTETVDYFILSSLKNFIKKLKVKPFICFEHNYHNTMDVEVAKQTYHEFLSECGYIGKDFELLSGDVSLTPIESTIVETTIINKEVLNLKSTTINTTDDNKPRIRIHNPSNSQTKDYRNYNRFWDDLTDYLKNFFNVEENRFFENAHSQRFPINLNKGISKDLFLLECEYVIENLDNGEFVIMSVSDDLTHAIINEKENPYLKKILVSQFLSDKIFKHTGKYMYKYSPWTYFQSSVIDLERFYYKRLLVKPIENKIYFKGTSLEDREFLNHINKDLITNFTPLVPELYFNDIIKYKLALSIDGRGEFCYRDIECFGIGVPILRFEYESSFYDELIPNYHYISVTRPSDMELYRLGSEEHYKLLEKRYMEVINDEEFLLFISKNARKYYEDNIFQNNKLKKTFELLNLKNWL